MAKNNECYYDGKSNGFNSLEITQRYCTECGAPGKLTTRPAAVLKHCNVHGDELIEVRQVCSQRNTFRNRLRSFLLLGYGHLDERAVTLHIDLAHKVKYIKGNA